VIAFSISTGWVPSRICSLACSYSRFNWTGSLKYIQYNTAHTADSAGLGPYNICNTILLIQQVQLDWVPIIYTIQYCSYSRFRWTGSLQYIQYNTAHTAGSVGLGPYNIYNTILLIQQIQLDWVPTIYTIQYCSYSRYSWTGSLLPTIYTI